MSTTAIHLVQDIRARRTIGVELSADAITLHAAPEMPGPLRGSTRIRLQDIREVQLNRAIPTRYGPGHHVCILIDHQGRRHGFRVNHDQAESMMASYREAVLALHAALATLPAQPKYMTGIRSRVAYYLMLGITGAAFALLEAAVVAGMLRKGNYGVGVLMLLGIPLVAWWLLRFMALMGKPSGYDPGQVPASLLP